MPDILFQIHRKQNNVYLISDIQDNVKREKNYFVLQNKLNGNISYKLNIGNEIKIGDLKLRVRKIHINNSNDKVNETKNISYILNENEERKGGIKNGKPACDISEQEPFNEINDNDSDNYNKCRICLESEMSKINGLNLNIENQNENILISPCNCKGEHKYIHLSCLKKWLKSRYGSESLNNDNSILYSFPNRCEICQGVFPDVVQGKDYYYDIADFMNINFDNYIEFEILNDNNNNENNNENFEKKFLILKLIKNDFCYIGKGDKNHYIFTNQDMSNKHSKLFLDNNGNVLISDYNSETGTFVKINRVIQLQENNIMLIQNKNTFIKIELISKNNCFLCPKSSKIYPEIYFNNNNLNLELKKIFIIKEKEKIENNNLNTDNNNNNVSRDVQIQINENTIKNNTYSTLITSSSNNSDNNSATNLFGNHEKIIYNNDLKNENTKSKIFNYDEYFLKKSETQIINDENFNPNLTYNKKHSNLYIINENDIISNKSRNEYTY